MKLWVGEEKELTSSSSPCYIAKFVTFSSFSKILLETIVPFFLMMEDYGAKWSLSILFGNTIILQFFIIGAILISLLASKNAQPQQQ